MTPAIAVTSGDVVTYYPALTGTAGNLCSALKFSIYDMGATTNASSPSGGTCIYPANCVTGTALSGLPASAASFTQAENLTAGSTRNLLIAISNASLDNSYQSQKATLSVAWHIDE